MVARGHEQLFSIRVCPTDHLRHRARVPPFVTPDVNIFTENVVLRIARPRVVASGTVKANSLVLLCICDYDRETITVAKIILVAGATATTIVMTLYIRTLHFVGALQNILFRQSNKQNALGVENDQNFRGINLPPFLFFVCFSRRSVLRQTRGKRDHDTWMSCSHRDHAGA